VPVQGFSAGPYEVWRRYSEFEMLWKYMSETCPHCILPPLPEKKINFKFNKMSVDKFDPAFVNKRMSALNSFIQRMAGHPVLSAQSVFYAFLTVKKMTGEAALFLIHETRFASSRCSRALTTGATS
jgi:sorting nexin-4